MTPYWQGLWIGAACVGLVVATSLLLFGPLVNLEPPE